jgi:hypothetical protein
MDPRDVDELPSSPPRASYAELERQRMELYQRVCLDDDDDDDLYAQHELIEVEQQIARSRELAGAISQRLAELSRLSSLEYNLDDFVRETSDMIDELPPSAVRDLHRQKLEDWRAGDQLDEKLCEIHMGLDLVEEDDETYEWVRERRGALSREQLLERLQRDIDGLEGEGPWLDQVHQRFAEARQNVSARHRQALRDIARELYGSAPPTPTRPRAQARPPSRLAPRHRADARRS